MTDETQGPSLEEMARQIVDEMAIDSRHKLCSFGISTMREIASIAVCRESNAKDAYRLIVARYGEKAISSASFYRWLREFRNQLAGRRRTLAGLPVPGTPTPDVVKALADATIEIQSLSSGLRELSSELRDLVQIMRTQSSPGSTPCHQSDEGGQGQA